MTKNSKDVMIVEATQSFFGQAKDSGKFDVPTGMMLVEGVLGVANLRNRNNRYYTLEEYARHIESFKQRIVDENGVFGEMEHPKTMNINLHNVSHKVMDVRIDESTGNVMGTLLLLDTPSGKVAQSIVRSKSALPVSSRALGSVDESTGKTTLTYLSTWDLVGTAGFKEANVKMIANESMQSGSRIVESAVIGINHSGSVINESAPVDNLNESEIQSIVEKCLSTKNTQITENIDMEDIIQAVDERFQSVYANAIEKWITEDYSKTMSDAIQKWVTEEFAPVVENWITTEYTPLIAESVQKWVVEEYSPELGTSVQKWITEEYSKELGTVIESWVQENSGVESTESIKTWIRESYTPQLANGIQNWLNDEYMPVVSDATEKWLLEEFAPNNSMPEVSEILESKIKNEANTFKTNVLETLDKKISDAENVKADEKVETKIDESHFKTGPAWLRFIPEEFKPMWQSLNESQQDTIYRRAALRDLKTSTDIDIFWKGIDFSRIVENSMPSSIKRQLNENAIESKHNPRKAVFELAKTYAS